MNNVLSNALLTELSIIYTDYKNNALSIDAYNDKATTAIMTHKVIIASVPILRRPLSHEQTSFIRKYIKSNKDDRADLLLTCEDSSRVVVEIYNFSCRKAQLEKEALQYALDYIGHFVYIEKQRLGLLDAGGDYSRFDSSRGTYFVDEINKLGLEWVRLRNMV